MTDDDGVDPAAGPYDLQKVIPPTPTQQSDSIVGGQPTTQFPDCAAVGNGSRYNCSGTLIAPRLVVTARHCREVDRVFLVGSDVLRPEQGETISVIADYEHPLVDLRVLVLDRDSTAKPRHVAQGLEARGEKAILVGFGTVDFDGQRGYGIKRRADVPIISLDSSEPGFGDKYHAQPGLEVVAGHRGLNRDSCKGDSGGPLYIADEQGLVSLLGATSRGIEGSGRVCGDGGVYVRIDQQLDWIRQVTGIVVEGPRW